MGMVCGTFIKGRFRFYYVISDFTTNSVNYRKCGCNMASVIFSLFSMTEAGVCIKYQSKRKNNFSCLYQVPPDTECGHGPLQRTVWLKLIFNPATIQSLITKNDLMPLV